MNKGVVDIETPEYSIYVDGSCLENMNVNKDTLAGWGMVVVKGDSRLGKGKGEIIFETSGLVVTNSDSNEYFGAEVGSNNTGELSAIAHALRWLLIND